MPTQECLAGRETAKKERNYRLGSDLLRIFVNFEERAAFCPQIAAAHAAIGCAGR
jgi:hypothetical protein